MNQPWIYICSPSWTPPPTSLPIPSLWVILVHQTWALVSCIEPGLAICFTYDNIQVSMLFCQITPPSPPPTESKRLFCTSVCLLLSRIEGYHYHLSKFHIYALVHSIGVILSFVDFWTLPCFLALSDTLGLSGTFSTHCQESAISPRSSGSFNWTSVRCKSRSWRRSNEDVFFNRCENESVT